MINKQEFEKQLAVIDAQSQMLLRICKNRNIDDLLNVITQESKRLNEEAKELDKKGKESGII